MRIALISLAMALFLGCNGPEPRRPVQAKSSTFFGGDIERNKKLLANEERQIKDLIAADSLHLYEASSSGSWYYYERRTNSDNDYPEAGDVVTLTYELLSLENDTIYTQDEIGEIRYVVDKQEIFKGLGDAIKLLKANEKATFLFPSSVAYGITGDNNRVGINVPLKATISILNIEKQKSE